MRNIAIRPSSCDNHRAYTFHQDLIVGVVLASSARFMTGIFKIALFQIL